MFKNLIPKIFYAHLQDGLGFLWMDWDSISYTQTMTWKSCA
jgi:hypothetical protein